MPERRPGLQSQGGQAGAVRGEGAEGRAAVTTRGVVVAVGDELAGDQMRQLLEEGLWERLGTVVSLAVPRTSRMPQ